jgi:hypothetical protein
MTDGMITRSVRPISMMEACAWTGSPLAVGAGPRASATISTRNGGWRGSA